MDVMDSVSVGVDIVSIKRISKNLDDRFIQRVYTTGEIQFCKTKINASHQFAGRLAGKEAVSKALKMTWEKGINWKDIEIVSNETNIPEVVLHGEAKVVATKRKIKNIQLSISHEQDYAIACAITVGYGNHE
jgi:holo-[acyl-carrier protein] synthase